MTRRVEPYTAKDGTKSWRVRFRHAGKQTSETFYVKRDAEMFAANLGAGGPAEAYAWLNAREAANGPDQITFAQWFDHYVEHLTGITERTRADYHAQKRRYLTDLDTVPLAAMTKAHVSKIVNRLERDGRSPKTIKNAVNLLASCLTAAVEEGHMTRNPARRTRLPSAKADVDDSTKFLTHVQYAQLLEAIPDHYKPLVITLAGTGLRWSEATALQWRDVNWAAHTVRVARAWKRVPGKGFELGPPKSAKSRRTVNVPPQVMEALGTLRLQVVLDSSAFIFTTPTGHPVSHANFHARIWKPAVKAAGLDITPHGLRHTHASWLISLGVQLEAVQDQLGHESILTTRGTYGHLLPALGAQVAQAAGVALASAGQPTRQIEG